MSKAQQHSKIKTLLPKQVAICVGETLIYHSVLFKPNSKQSCARHAEVFLKGQNGEETLGLADFPSDGSNLVSHQRLVGGSRLASGDQESFINNVGGSLDPTHLSAWTAMTITTHARLHTQAHTLFSLLTKDLCVGTNSETSLPW